MCGNHLRQPHTCGNNEDAFLRKLEIIGFFCVSIPGTLLHFAYEFFHYNFIVGLFAPVNESTFEHLKLLLYPMLAYSVIEYLILKKKKSTNLNSFLCAKTRGIISGITSIIVLFYTYLGILGFNVDFINIAIYFIAVMIAFCVSYAFTINKKKDDHCLLCLFILAVLVILFLIFTIYPVDIGLFRSP